MVRIIGFFVGLFFGVMALWAFGTGLYTQLTSPPEKTAASVFHRQPRDLKLSSNGWFGHWGEKDYAQLQRGFQVYKEVCSACHSLDHVAFRDLSEIGYSDAEVKAIAAGFMVPGVDPNTGESTLRPGTPTDYFPKPFANDIAARAANHNAIPPDLSLITKAREGGASYVYSLITGFQPMPPEVKKEFPDFDTPPGLYYNPYFPNLNLAMPPPLTSNGQVQYKDGTNPTVDQMAKDVAAFLVWTAEPSLAKRHQVGVPVIFFLIFATILAFLAKKQVWADAKARRADVEQRPERQAA
jgi:ubiquinol-cytochrome c reductase cytochrome c1 subunit